jgi:hypothetical protein
MHNKKALPIMEGFFFGFIIAVKQCQINYLCNMEYNEHFELVLNHITARESYPWYKDTFEDYKQTAYTYLNHEGKHLFKEDILSHFNEGADFEKILKHNDFQYLPGMYQNRNGKRERTWYDIMGMEVIEASKPMGDFFFTCKLRHLALLQIDDYLNYHLEHSFANDKQKFLRYLNLTIRTYEKQLGLKPELVETVKEWIKIVETSPELSETEKSEKTKDKDRMQREAGDKFTSLSLVQTVMLIEYMQKAGMVLNRSRLTFTQAGKAFNLLTGYSSNSIRLQLGKAEGIKNEDYGELHRAILKLAKLIEPDIPKK